MHTPPLPAALTLPPATAARLAVVLLGPTLRRRYERREVVCGGGGGVSGAQVDALSVELEEERRQNEEIQKQMQFVEALISRMKKMEEQAPTPPSVLHQSAPPQNTRLRLAMALRGGPRLRGRSGVGAACLWEGGLAMECAAADLFGACLPC
jgi:hypothetical protein